MARKEQIKKIFRINKRLSEKSPGRFESKIKRIQFIKI